jgi:DNA repair exonuclease SbcCD ATPase subunit
MTGIDQLEHYSRQLEEAAAQLRIGELEPEQAARLVEECARLAGDAANELERRVRTAADPPPPGQTTLQTERA